MTTATAAPAADDRADEPKVTGDVIAFAERAKKKQAAQATKKDAALPLNTVVARDVAAVLDDLGDAVREMSLDELIAVVFKAANGTVEARNALARQEAMIHGGKPRLTPMFQTIPIYVIAAALSRRLHTVRLSLAASTASGDDDSDGSGLLAVYVDDPDSPGYGTYTLGTRPITTAARYMCPGLSEREVANVVTMMREAAPRGVLNTDPNLVAVANGIFHHDTQTLHPFTPEFVTLTKTRVKYVDDPVNPKIDMPDGGTWDVESWISDLFDDEEVEQLIWEIISATLRPNVAWGMSPWFYSSRGRNGKGTLLRMLTNMVPSASHSINDLNKRFTLGSLISSAPPSLIFADENDVNLYVASMARYKELVTGDPVPVERKGVDGTTVRWRGVIIQCVNALPRVNDNTRSLLRRVLLVPFEKHFDGDDRTYIKDDYLGRPEVLEYVQHRALAMRHTRLSEPAVCRLVKNEFAKQNDAVAAFWADTQDLYTWEILPYDYLYETFINWYRAEHRGSSDRAPSRRKFIQNLHPVVDEREWKRGQHRAKRSMTPLSDGLRGIGTDPEEQTAIARRHMVKGDSRVRGLRWVSTKTRDGYLAIDRQLESIGIDPDDFSDPTKAKAANDRLERFETADLI